MFDRGRSHPNFDSNSPHLRILKPGDLRMTPISLLTPQRHTKKRRNFNRTRTRGARKKESGH